MDVRAGDVVVMPSKPLRQLARWLVPFSRHHASQCLGYRIDGGSAVLAWLVAESLSQLLPLQPDEQLGAADVYLFIAFLCDIQYTIGCYATASCELCGRSIKHVKTHVGTKTKHVLLLADSLWAHSTMSHPGSFASEGATVPCRNFVLARIDAGNSRGKPASTDRSGHDRGRVTPRTSWARIWVQIRQSCWFVQLKTGTRGAKHHKNRSPVKGTNPP